MTQAPLIPKTAEIVFQGATISMLGLPVQPSSYETVQVSWQQEGQPAYGITDDRLFIQATLVDDEYNRVRDAQILVNPDDDSGNTVIKRTTYIRVWECFWEMRGPNSFDNARQVHSALLDNDFIDYFLAAFQLAMVTDPPAPRRAPENKDGQWWDRSDFECRFNELVTEDQIIGTVSSVEIVTYVPTSTQPISDVTVAIPEP